MKGPDFLSSLSQPASVGQKTHHKLNDESFFAHSGHRKSFNRAEASTVKEPIQPSISSKPLQPGRITGEMDMKVNCTETPTTRPERLEGLTLGTEVNGILQ